MPYAPPRRPALCFACCVTLALAALFWNAAPASAKGAGPKLPHAGFRSIGIWHPDTGMRLDVAVWYPSSRTPRAVQIEGWTLLVSKDNAGTPGKYPVILLSHDTAASRFASHDLAAALARHGFIIVAPTHPGDNVNDTGGLYHAAIFAERPKHLLLALDATARHPAIGPLLDGSRVGVLGVGAGAATVLQLAGAGPDLARLAGYCSPESPRDPLCSNWAKSLHPRMQREFALLTATGDAAFTPFSPGTEQPLAVGLLTPGHIGLFPDASLRGLTAPVGILAAMRDTVYPSRNTVERLQELLPQRPASRVLQNANHFALQAPSPPVYRDTFAAPRGGLTSPENDARAIRDDFFIRFFQKTLGPPLPPPS